MTKKTSPHETKRTALKISGTIWQTLMLFLGSLVLKVCWNSGIVPYYHSATYMRYITALSILCISNVFVRLAVLAVAEEMLDLAEKIIDELASKLSLEYSSSVTEPERDDDDDDETNQ